MPEHKPAASHEVFKWPEFRAFAKRIGLDMESDTRPGILRLVIEFPSPEEPLTVSVDYAVKGETPAE